jgi:hypothetical protein
MMSKGRIVNQSLLLVPALLLAAGVHDGPANQCPSADERATTVPARDPGCQPRGDWQHLSGRCIANAV